MSSPLHTLWLNAYKCCYGWAVKVQTAGIDTSSTLCTLCFNACEHCYLRVRQSGADNHNVLPAAHALQLPCPYLHLHSPRFQPSKCPKTECTL